MEYQKLNPEQATLQSVVRKHPLLMELRNQSLSHTDTPKWTAKTVYVGQDSLTPTAGIW